MDPGRKINKIDKPLTSKKPELSFVGVTAAFLLKDEPSVKDHQLINWKRWLKRHQKQYQVLDKGGPQNKTNMVKNSCEKIRSKIEMSNLIEYTTISASSVPDRYRGDLGFWQEPSLFSNHGNSCLSKVGPVLTKKELNLLPTLEYVGMPTSIRKEENLLNPLQKVPAWNCSSYVKKKKHEMADTMAILQPSIPKAASFISRGQGSNHDEKYVAHVSVISIRDMSLGNEDSEFKIRESSVSTAGAVNLKINDLEITRDEQSIYKSSESTSEESTWTLNFPTKIDQISQKYLYFENTGTVAITYQWRNAITTSKILPLFSRNYAKFFFNKNKALILPGQKVEFPIWFQSRQAGTFSESWRLETQPIVSRAALIIRMCGNAAVENIHTSQLEVDVYLDCCIRNTAIRETIDEIIHNVMPSGAPEPTYKSLYLEADIFQVKNLSYFYHASLVTQLYRLYTTTSALDVSLWTLSLVDLRRVLLRIKDPNLRHESLKMFGDLCQQCLGPCLFNPVRNTKYAMVYSVLCASVNRMEEESDSVKRNCILTDTNRVTSTETGNRSSPNSLLATPDVKPLRTTSDRSFYVRTYELLVEAVEQACVVIDSLKNLNELEQ